MALRTTSTTVSAPNDMSESEGSRTPHTGPDAMSEGQAATTLALTMVSAEQIGRSAAMHESALLRDQLAMEQSAHRLQRANAEQARRTAECLRACHATLLQHLQQPCFQLDRNGLFVYWNTALADATGISAAQALGHPLAACFPAPACERIESALHLALAAETQPEAVPVLTLQGPLPLSSVRNAAELSLIPLYHIPGVIGAFIALICL